MTSVLLNLLPLEIGAAIVPLWITLTLLVLQGNNGIARAWALVAGAMTMRLLQGALFGYVLRGETGPDGADAADPIVSTLLLLAGIVLLVTFVRTLFRQEDPDAPPPGWLARIGGVPPPLLFGLGALMMALSVKQWVFTLSAIAVIDDAGMGRPRSVLAYLAFVIAAHALVLAPIICSMSMPDRGHAMHEAGQRWLERNGRPLTMAVSLVFGVLFLWIGIAGVSTAAAPPAAAPPLTAEPAHAAPHPGRPEEPERQPGAPPEIITGDP